MSSSSSNAPHKQKSKYPGTSWEAEQDMDGEATGKSSERQLKPLCDLNVMHKKKYSTMSQELHRYNLFFSGKIMAPASLSERVFF